MRSACNQHAIRGVCAYPSLGFVHHDGLEVRQARLWGRGEGAVMSTCMQGCPW